MKVVPMRKLAVLVVALALALGTVPAAQAAIVSEKVGGSVGKVAKAADAEINAFFSGYTFILKSRNVMPSFPFNGGSFVYFAPNGTLALWRGWGGLCSSSCEVGIGWAHCFEFDRAYPPHRQERNFTRRPDPRAARRWTERGGGPVHPSYR